VGSEGGGDMGFHVDGERTGRMAERAFGARRYHGALDAGDVRHDHTLGMIRETRRETMGDGGGGRVTAIGGRHAGRHDHIAGSQ
jgi:hypothetical protein